MIFMPRSKMMMLICSVGILAGCKTTDLNNLPIERMVSTALDVASTLDTSTDTQRGRAMETRAAILKRNRHSRDQAMASKLKRMVDQIALANNLEHIRWEVHFLADRSERAYTPGGGIIFIHEGMIARTKTEAMMAMLLAHEMAHVTEGHPAIGSRDQKLVSVALSELDAYLAGATRGTTNRASRLAVQYSNVLAASGYSRSTERSADDIGFRYFINAGYDPFAASELFLALHNRYGSRPVVSQAVAGTHPQFKDRADRLDVLALREKKRRGGIRQTPEWSRLQRKYQD